MTIPHQRLICKNCPMYVDIIVPEDQEKWPLHRCSKTRKAERFSTFIGIPKIPIREWPDEPRAKPGRKPLDLSYLKVIG